MALADRFRQSSQAVVIEKEVARPVIIRAAAPSVEPQQSIQPLLYGNPPLAEQPNLSMRSIPAAPVGPDPNLPAPRPLNAPEIADPRCERLVNEARESRVAGDMRCAIMKLEEAMGISRKEPAILYELGMVHEQMGIFGKASDYYQKVFELGTSGAGRFFPMAATKLRDGFEKPTDLIGRLSLGRVRIFQPIDKSRGESVLLTIPVQKAPSFEADLDQIEVSVVFFNRTNHGEIVQLEDDSWVKQKWISMPFEWAGGEEQLRMNYTIPPLDTQTEHLFGSRSYYGQVVTLRYKGEILDVQAWPRDLAGRIPGAAGSTQGSDLFPDFLDTLPPDFDPDLGVLPPNF